MLKNYLIFKLMTIKKIRSPIEKHLKEYNKFIKDLMSSDVALLDIVIQYLSRKKGKQVRPVLVMLSAELCGAVNQRTYIGAAMSELLHTATLVHDDVVDESSTRRGIASINASWNNKIAVLIGDYLLAKGLLSAIDKDEFEFLKATSNAVKRMSEGELLQIQKSKEFDIDYDTYYQIISNKTASLIASCCEIGAISSTNDKKKQDCLRNYGENIGIAFQIRDDIFDYQSKTKIIGKPVGNDLKEKKLTLPLIYSIKQVSKKSGKEILDLIKKDKLKKSEIKKIIEFVNDNGGIDYAEKISKEYSQKASTYLTSFPDNPSKQSLLNFCDFVIDRNK